MTLTHPEPDVDGRLGIVVAELSGEVLRLRRELTELRADLATELRTKRIVVVGDDRSFTTEIKPASVRLESAPLPDKPDTGAYIDLGALRYDAEICVAAGLPANPTDGYRVKSVLWAGFTDDDAGRAGLYLHGDGEQEQHEIKVTRKASS